MRTYVRTANVDNSELRYFKTVVKGEEENIGSDFYGVFVEKYVGDKLVEEMDSNPLTESEAHIDEIINRLAEDTVTPFGLPEALDDYKRYQLQQDNIPA